MACIDTLTNADVAVFIAPQADLPEDNLKASWEAITTWVEIKGVSSISGPRGVKRAASTFKPLKGNLCYSPGGTDYGNLSFGIAEMPEDPGQIALDAATLSKFSYPVKIVQADATLTLDVPTTEYVAGPVLSFTMDQASDPDAMRMRTAEIAANAYLRVPRYDSV